MSRLWQRTLIEWKTPGSYTATLSRWLRPWLNGQGIRHLTKLGEQAGPKSALDHDAADSPESKLVGGPIQTKKELAAKANPITFVTKDDPPVLMLHGDKDPLVPLAQSELLLDSLKKAGVEAELVVVKGNGHGGPGFASVENQEKIAKFFEKHLKK